jgi:hypothetical protein
MTASDGSSDFRYMQTDIPEGMTIREWRAERAVNRPRRHRWWLRCARVGRRGVARGDRSGARAISRIPS